MTFSELIENHKEAQAGLHRERRQLAADKDFQISRLRLRVVWVGVFCFFSGGVLAFSIALVFGV